MIVFVPLGDASKEDATRLVAEYDRIANYFTACGARAFDPDGCAKTRVS
jgi:hypothetical protein